MTETYQLKDSIEQISHELETIDILINGPGNASETSLDQIDESEFDHGLKANLKSAFVTVKYTVPYLKQDGGEIVVFISSNNAKLGGFGEVGYFAAKN